MFDLMVPLGAVLDLLGVAPDGATATLVLTQPDGTEQTLPLVPHAYPEPVDEPAPFSKVRRKA